MTSSAGCAGLTSAMIRPDARSIARYEDISGATSCSIGSTSSARSTTRAFPMDQSVRNDDQASFYSETYDLLAGFRERGWVAFLEEIAGFRRAGGMTFVIQGGIMGALAGYSRTAVLSL